MGKKWLANFAVQAIFRGVVWLYLTIEIVCAMAAPMGAFDDAIPLIGADLINHGRLPQVDFATVYPPLQQFVIALGFRLAGRTVLVNRFLSAALLIAVVVTADRFFRARAGVFRPLAPLMTLLVAVGASSSIRIAAWPGYAVATIGLIVYFMDEKVYFAGVRWPTILAGLLTGVSTLIRFNFGIYAAAVVLLELVVCEMSMGKHPWNLRLRRILLCYAAFLLPLVFVNAIFYLSVYGVSAVVVLLDIVAAAHAAIGDLRFIDLRVSWLLIGILFWPLGWLTSKMIVGGCRRSERLLIPSVAAMFLLFYAFAASTNPHIAVWLPLAGIVAVIVLGTSLVKVARPGFGLLLYYACGLHYYLKRADVFYARLLFVTIALMVPLLFVSPVGDPAIKRPESPGIVLAFIILIGSIGFLAGISDFRRIAHFLSMESI